MPTPSVAKVKTYPVQDLDHLATRHYRATQSAPLSLSGRQLPLIYKLVATLIAAPHSKAVVIVDIDARFDITSVLQCAPYSTSAQTAHPQSTRVPAQQRNVDQKFPGLHTDRATLPHGRRVTLEDLKHVHVYRTARGSPSHIRDVLTSAEHYMIYSRHASALREWWGSIVIGGGSPTTLGSAHADVTTGWKGWLRVDREEVRGFPAGMSLEEALSERDQRQRAANAVGYRASCVWGAFTFDK